MAESTDEYTDPEVLIAEDIVFEPEAPTKGPTGVHTSFVRELTSDDPASLRDLSRLSATSHREETKEEMSEQRNRSSRASIPGVYIPGTEDQFVDESTTSLNLADHD
jgi:hypothetical protein